MMRAQRDAAKKDFTRRLAKVANCDFIVLVKWKGFAGWGEVWHGD
jgi:hypothetical protein